MAIQIPPRSKEREGTGERFLFPSYGKFKISVRQYSSVHTCTQSLKIFSENFIKPHHSSRTIFYEFSPSRRKYGPFAMLIFYIQEYHPNENLTDLRVLSLLSHKFSKS